MNATRKLLALSLLALFAACGDDPPRDEADVTDTSDAADTTDTGIGTDATDTDTVDTRVDADTGVDADVADTRDPLVDEWPEIPATEADEGADPTAWVPGEALRPGEAHVGVVTTAGSPFSGPEARCRPGDLVLANEHLSACIAGLLAPSQYTFTGGYIVDLAPTDAMDGEILEAVVPGIDLRVTTAQQIAVLRDGRDGGPAVVAVSGIDGPLAVLGNFIGDLFRGAPLRFETEFRLDPDAAFVEVVTWIQSDDPELVRARVAPGDLLIAGDHVTAWAPGFGDLGPFFQADTPLWMGVAADFAYGLYSEDLLVKSLAPGLLESDIAPTEMTNGVIGPRTVAVFTRYLAVGRDTFDVLDAFHDFVTVPDDAPTSFTGPVDEAHTERRYEIATADGDPVGVVRLDDAGEAGAPLPAGEYIATWWGHDDEAARTAFTVPADGPVALATPEQGLMRLWVEALDDGDVAPSPAKAVITGPVTREVYVVRGALAVPLPPGTYGVTVRRGEEFSLDLVSDVVVPAGGEVTVEASLERTMDTAGWVSGDFHQHSRRSVDSAVENTDRVATNLAAGVDLIAPTDHDAIENYVQIVEDMGVDDLLHTLVGIEVSPAWGHLNAFPMVYDPSLVGFGAVQLSELTGRTIRQLNAPELVAEARARGARVVQVNHPREGAAYFSASGYDPVVGPGEVDEAFWPGTFESVEVVNDADRVCEVMRDWFSLLSRGYRIAGVGNSDTHGFGDPAGWPRNYMASPTDDPGALDDDIVLDAITDLAVSVSGGVFLDFPDGELPGDTVQPDEGQPFSLRVRAQSPEWARADVLVTYVDGIEVDRQAIGDGADAAIVDFDDTIELDLDADAYVVFFAYGTGRHPVVTPGKQIFGFTNPIFVDVDRNGEWTPPGVAGTEDVPWPTDLPFCPGE